MPTRGLEAETAARWYTIGNATRSTVTNIAMSLVIYAIYITVPTLMLDDNKLVNDVIYLSEIDVTDICGCGDEQSNASECID